MNSDVADEGAVHYVGQLCRCSLFTQMLLIVLW